MNGPSVVDKQYLEDHNKRFGITIKYMKEYLRHGQRWCNVGVSDFDDVLRNTFQDVEIYSLIPDEKYLANYQKALTNRSFFFDLCDPRPREVKINFDAVIMTEVLEHLFADDRVVLHNVSNLLKECGVLFLTVPNAATLRHRLMLMFGKNIHWSKDRIVRGVYGGYGHIREYTFQEIRSLVEEQGFDVMSLKGINGYRTGIKSLFNILPQTYSNTILLIGLKK